jgi:hypothetical protein
MASRTSAHCGLAVLGYRMRGYQKPQVTRSYQEVLTPLLASSEEFCPVLRPFGQDGETFLPKYQGQQRSLRRILHVLSQCHLA